MATLGRLFTAMATPFDEEGRVDYDQARRLAVGLVDGGSDGLVVSGTTGESPTLTTEEKLRLFAEVKEAVGDRATIIAGTCNYNTAESIELTHEAEKSGADAILGTVPYYNKPPQEGLYQHFTTIARSTSLPVILYNVPARTVTNMTAETVIRLSAIDNIVGVKEASGDFGQITSILDGTPEDFFVFSGNDSDTFPMLAMGAHGVISVASHLVGGQIKAMIDRFVEGDVSGAAKLHRDLTPISRALFVVANPIPLKAALNARGFRVGKPRLPLVDLDEKQLSALMQVVNQYELDGYLT
ncbi:MAG: 4-hydroxy-tetrahydrodipicolinate synthase [Chloroflexi bacterium]|nr:4-hydroxy-tetrahydrodipicolinate synthase [Chloroflexota bacterium]